MPYADDYQSQLDKINSWSVANGRVNAAMGTVTQQQANGVAAQSAAAPWTDPGTSVALGMNGSVPGDPLSNQVHVASLNKKHGGFWSALGSVVPDVQHIMKLGIRGLATGAETLGQVGMGVVRDAASVGGDIVGGAVTGMAVGAAAGLATPLEAFTIPVGLIGGAIGGAVAGGVAQARGVEVKGGFVNPLAQSTGGQVLGSLVGGHKVDIGTGFTAGGDIRKKQVAASQAAASINGHALTPGRMLASAVFNPGSEPYNLLSGMADVVTQWELDPARHVLGEAGAHIRQGKQIITLADEAGPITRALTKAPEAESIFHRMGLINAASPATDLEKAANFINSDKAAIAFAERTGTPFVKASEGVAQQGDSALDIWNASGRKLPPSVATALEGANTPQEAQAIMKSSIAERIVNEKAAFDSGSGITSTFRNYKANSRLLSFMPGHGVDLIDMDKSQALRDFKLSTAVEKVDSWMQSAHFDPALRNEMSSKLLAAKSQLEASQIIDDITQGHLSSKLTEMGASPERVKQLMKTTVTAEGELRDHVQQEIGKGRAGYGVVVAPGTLPISIARPNEINEALDNIKHLPDPRLLQQMTNPSDSLRALYKTSMWQGSVALGDRFMGTLWKPLNLIRPALGVRMVAMESVKMSANGLESPLSHPMTLVKMVFNPDLRPGNATDGALQTVANGALHDAGMSNMMDKTSFQRTVAAGDDAAASTWAARTVENHLDPVARYAAENGLEATKRALYGGELEPERLKMVAAGGQIDVGTKAASDAYVDKQIASHLSGLTADNPEVVKAIANGYAVGADGKPIHFDHLVAKQAEIEAAANKAADVAAEKAVRAARVSADRGPQGVEDVLQEVDKPSDIETAAQRAAAKAAKREALNKIPDAERGTPVAKAVLPKMTDAEVHAAATKAADAAAEKAVRSAIKGAGTEAVTPAEKLSEVERVAKNAADKAARDAARAEIPQGAKTAATGKVAPFEKPLGNAERKSLETQLKAAKEAVRNTTGTQEAVDGLQAQLTKDNAAVKAVMAAKKAGVEPTFAKEAKALTTEEQATVEKVRQSAYDAAANALKGNKPVLSEADQLVVDHVRQTAYEAAVEAGKKQVLAKGQLINPAFEEHLQGLLDDPNIKTPTHFIGGKPIEAVDPDYNVKANKTVRWLYSTLISRPMNFLVRSPEFNQLQWKNMASLVPGLTEESAAALRESMEAATAQIPHDTRVMLEHELERHAAGVERARAAAPVVATRAATSDASPELFDELSHWRESGKPGIVQESASKPIPVDPTDPFAAGDAANSGFKDTAFVSRGADGKVNGVLRVKTDPQGVPNLLHVAVDPAAQRQGIATKLYKAATDAGIDVEKASGVGGYTSEGAAFARGRRAAVATNFGGKIELHDALEAAKIHALGQMADMTINMAHKTGWQDATRLMAPFSKHWQQELTQWAKIGVEHPDALRKVQMTVQGAEGNGFFYKDDQGKWAFNYPGAGLVSSVVGAPFGMKASVSGLSALTSNALPSFGPLVTIPASKILAGKPSLDSIANFIAPYGDPSAKGVVDAILPAWAKTMKTALQDPQSDNDMGNYTMQMAKYLVSTGEYDMDTEADVQKTLDEAASRAKHLLWLQAFGKAVLPSSPTEVPMAQDKDGRTVVAKTLAADLAKMRADDYSTSTQKFLDKYGDNAFLYLQATTRSSNLSVGGLDTNAGYDFLRNNKDLITALPNSYGFFAPQSDPNSTYNYNAFQMLTKSGDREKLTPLEQTHLANNQLGSMQYYKLKDSLGPKPSQDMLVLLAQYKDVLKLKYPGFTTANVGLAQRATTPQVIDELTNAVKTMPKIADTSVGKAIKQYLSLRDAAIAIAKSRGSSFQQSVGNADIRSVLRQAGALLTQQTPGFGLVFDQVFDNEMKDLAAEPSLTGAS